MALPLHVDTLESVPEPFRSEYLQGDDGFSLNVEGIEGLKSALEKERSLNKSIKRAGLTEETFSNFVASSERFDKVLEQIKAGHDAERAAWQSERKAILASERDALINATLDVALSKGGVTPEGMDLMKEMIGDRIKIEHVDGKRVAKIFQADGKSPMAGTGKDGMATFADLVKETRQAFPSQFYGTGAGGGGAPSVQRPPPSKSLSRSEFDRLSATDRAARMRDGYTIHD